MAAVSDPGQDRGASFNGAKAVLLCEGRLAVLRRDDVPHITWPGRIDLPGGGREGEETPETCALRETEEEIGIRIEPSRVVWMRRYPGTHMATWLVLARITPEEAGSLKLGDEGQACWMMELRDYLSAKDAIPRQQARVRQALAAFNANWAPT